jgi:hypothetical protein
MKTENLTNWLEDFNQKIEEIDRDFVTTQRRRQATQAFDDLEEILRNPDLMPLSEGEVKILRKAQDILSSICD